MITHSSKLDMCPGGVPLAINLSQYDSDVQLVFELFASRGSFVIESGTTVAIRGTKPDGNGIDLDAAISDNVVTVSVTQQMTAVAGTSYYELTLYKGDKELNTANFRLIIERAALDKDTLISGSEIRELVDIIDRTDEIIQAAADIQQTAEDLQEYVDAKEAEISQITTDAEETAQEALDEVTNVKNDLHDMLPDLHSDSFSWEIGKTINSSGKVTSSVSTALTGVIPVTQPFRVVNKSNAVGMNDKDTIFYVSEYVDEEWQKRTLVASGDSLDIEPTTDAIRIVFGYAGSAGNTETREDVDANFAVQLIQRVALQSGVDGISAILGLAFNTDYRNAETIADNTDYDTIAAPGNYYVSTSAHAQTMINCPVTVAHRLTVITKTSTSMIIQCIFANAVGSPVYVRNIGEDWQRLASYNDTLTTAPGQIVSSNVPTTDFNTLPLGKIYTLLGTAVNLMDNAPKGNANVAGAADSYGKATGTLMTVKGATYNEDTAEVQLMFSQSSGDFAQPILNFRTKYYSNNEWRWTPWAQFAGLYGVMRATNTFIQESRIQAGTADFSDMDNAPNNTIYQIDLDAVSMAHNPISGRSCVLITFSPSFSSDHGSMQLCAGLDNNDAYTPQMYYRYGYQQSSSEYRWTNWVKLSGDIPTAPVVDGTYTLKCTVSNGAVTYAWVSD